MGPNKLIGRPKNSRVSGSSSLSIEVSVKTLDARKIPNQFAISPGDHGYEFVKSVFDKSLGFLKSKLATK